MPEPRRVSIVICMGSSCFSRGNNRNIEVIQAYAAANHPEITLEARGHLCKGLCKNGPNLLIDGKLYQNADPVTVAGAIQESLLPRPPEGSPRKDPPPEGPLRAQEPR